MKTLLIAFQMTLFLAFLSTALCPDLVPPPNGAISYSPDNGGPFREIGTIATHSCAEGFFLVGAETRECVSGGVFDGTAPSCEGMDGFEIFGALNASLFNTAIVCAELQEIENGAISYAPDSEGPVYDLGTVATYTCDEGFELIGEDSRTCEDVSNGPSGEFTGTAPTCECKSFI